MKSKKERRERYMKERRKIMEKKYKPEELFKKGYAPGIGSLFFQHPGLKFDIEKKIMKGVLGKKVLEIGPGRNPFARSVRDRTYLDASKFFLERLEGKKVLGKVEKLPFKDKKFDAVVMSDVLCNIRSRSVPKAIREMTRVSDEILIIDYNKLDEKGRFKRTVDYRGMKVPSIRHEIKVDQIKDVLSKEGYKVRVMRLDVPLIGEEGKVNLFIIKAKRLKKSR